MKNHYAIATSFFLCIFSFNATLLCVLAQTGGYNNSNTLTANPNIHINIGMTQEMVSTVKNYITTTLNGLNEGAHKAYDASKAGVENLKEWVFENKLKVILYSTGLTYAYITYKLFTLKYALIQPDNWSLWHTHLSLDELYTIPEKQLGETLVKEAQQRYTIIDDPENFITPLITFLKLAEQEKQLLQSYITLCDGITKLHLSRIFWFDETLAHTCKERLKRLAYLRSIFVSWITEYKFMHNVVPATA